jgi:single-stranded-DNA-specific exonuclease
MQRKIKRRDANQDIVFPDDLHPVLKKIYSSRGIVSANELAYSLDRLLTFESLKGISDAARLLADAIEQEKYILIVSDYDADGATACALGIRGLMAMGASHVEYLVPDRFKHGYGLSPDVVDLAMDFNPDIIVTVDNGISSIDGVARARAHGVDVIITDHHLPGKDLPDANAIVNPNQPGDSFPSKSIAGVGVMFYTLAALRSELRGRNWFESQSIREPNLAAYLDLVALGTVADVVSLDYNNRILVAYGIDLIRAGKSVPGISALLKVAGKNIEGLVASDLGFTIGPRLNAAGRLSDMSLGIESLISNDENACRDMAVKLDELNKERREIQDEMHQQALQFLSSVGKIEGPEEGNGVCLYNPEWHQGVIGILASKIKDKLQRPVIIFAQDEEGCLKGSGRSITGIHIRDVLDRLATLEPGLIITFGGHAMAAGLTIPETELERFTHLFNNLVGEHIRSHGLESDIYTDGNLRAEDINLETAEAIRNAGPWGQGFPEPVFDGTFEVTDKRIVGENHLKLRVKDRELNQ